MDESVLGALVAWLKPIARGSSTIMDTAGNNWTGTKALIATIVLSSLVKDYQHGCRIISIDPEYINSTKFGRHLDLLGYNISIKETRKALLGVI